MYAGMKISFIIFKSINHLFQVHRPKYFKPPSKTFFYQKQTQSVVLLFCYHAAIMRYPCACHSVVKTSLVEGEHGVFN